MHRAIERLNGEAWDRAAEVGTVTLPFDDRHRRRIRLIDDGGVPFLLDLTEAEHLHDGDGLRLDSGGILRVCSASEAVLDIECADATHTARVAWHIGNRHVPLQVLRGGVLRIRADHVLAEMLRGLGAKVTDKEAAFSPEAGAYATGEHEHDHKHGPDTHEH